MDPLTHLLVGVGIAEFSGEKLSLTNPVYIATVMGALAPDLDIVYQLRGHIAYLRNHRGFSHSVPGILTASLIIGFSLHLIMGTAPFSELFIWALVGGVSHILLDILNSYGAQVFWPISKKKYSLNLLVLFDPIIVLLFLTAIIMYRTPKTASLLVLIISVVYLLFRLYMKYSVYVFLRERYRDQKPRKIIVMPAMVSLWNWNFLVETETKYIVGEAKWLSFKTGVKRVLEKVPQNKIVSTAMHSAIGRLFHSFTPYYHIHCYQDGDNHVVCFADLRYFVKGDFLHNATVVLSKECEIAEAVFQPYSKNHKLSF